MSKVVADFDRFPVLKRIDAQYQIQSEREKEWILKIRNASHVVLFEPDDKHMNNEKYKEWIFIPLIPADLQRDSYDLWYEIVKKDGLLIRRVSDEMRNEKLVLCAVSQNGLALAYGSKFQNDDIIKAAINQNPVSIRYAKYISTEFCELALRRDKTVMNNVASSFFTNEIIEFLLSYDDEVIAATIPKKCLDRIINAYN